MDLSATEQLLKKIQELEAIDVQLKEEMSKLVLSTTSSSCVGLDSGNKLDYNGQVSHLNSTEQSRLANPRGKHYYRNRAAEHLYGYSASEAQGRNILGFIVEERDFNEASEIVRRNSSGEIWTGQFPLRNKHGRRFQITATNTPLYDDSGTFVGIICLSCDSDLFREVTTPVSFGTNTSKNDAYPKPGFASQQHSEVSSKTSTLASRMTKKLWSKMRIRESTMKCETQGGSWCFCCQGFPETISADHRLVATKEVSLGNPFGDSADDEGSHKTRIYKMITSRVMGISWQPLEIIEQRKNRDQQYQVLESNLFAANEASGGNETCMCGDGTNSSSNPRRELYMDAHAFCYDISWNTLTFGAQLGKGSCATVCHGQWYGSDVAIKVLLMKRLRHPNVLLFMGAATSPHHLCIVTEFLPRGSLFQLFRRHTPTLNWKRRVQMALDIAQGMNHLHLNEPPIIHRDLKSSNLLVDRNWTVKVGDFGLSRLKHATFLTTRNGKGTPQWMAPEVIRNEPADEKSDVYSFGVILWELATLQIPWDGLTSMQVIAAVGFMDKRNEIPKETDSQWASLIKSSWHSFISVTWHVTVL
ncbi:LEAF RUST 10 DISEASE-RESISTANCE LOCUS RECEPTOR-LIKE PROTEIN KINASE-like 1.3 [Papaver somniferum]|uniref:LEAF RUST 10 DISEASE-RESISTANCE LOCUS RECEPTOR-LIKE PROTEIN KINASE-like 1.3 n=1 Tax=Papaver somniferum TaxID=3469 RepID=UPI000E6FF9F3|nr:LEAF RUST 10 DISEASE-RESISTANCE LOCUS RECEPTOR-LIKE PROTEIN KINASE-like 1.3 [Papaver somniferum]